MSASSGADKTEKPTPKRKRDARRDGRIARSVEIATWTSVLATTYILPLALSQTTSHVLALFEQAGRAIEKPDQGVALGLLGKGLLTVALVSLPLAVGLMVLGVLTNVAQVGFAASSKMLRPKMERLNPLAGVKRLLSPASMWEAAKTAAKLAVLAWMAVKAVNTAVPRLVGGGRAPWQESVALVAGSALSLARSVAVVGLVLAAVDYGFQRRRLSKSLAMTKQEVKDEHKQSEGDPFMKGAIRSRQLAMSRNRMMAAVSTADVVLVNPTHVAVALKYQPDRGAPRVVAKGAGAVAARIRAEAEEHGVPLVTDVPLARTLWKACRLGDEIPPDLYDAVARILAFIFSLRAKRTGRPAAIAAPRRDLSTSAAR
ncbi:MAG TPA: EscU/YscU/HrcU family type III secretion system export apparatus switch protein [Acidimicrobiales bacterium]|nr:EscU/YscU/HrcU family type III secretion system export apparatus switch protein [Acidimicrobiales bacterium]